MNDPKVLVLFIEGLDVANVERAAKIVNTIGDQSALLVLGAEEHAELAESVGVTASPTLVRLSPDPRRKVTDLCDTEEVAAYLGKEWTPATG